MKNITFVVVLSLCAVQTACAQHDSHTATEQAKSTKTPVSVDLGKVNADTKKQLIALNVAYFALKDALVATDAQATSTKATDFLTALKGVDVAKMSTKQQAFLASLLPEMEEDAKHISSNVEIGHQRGHLNRISNHLFAIDKAFKANKATIYQQFCPMAFNDKGAFWLSDKKEIRNPYFGDKMLKCGKVTDTF